MLNLGDEVTVRVDDIDNSGKLSLCLVGDDEAEGGSDRAAVPAPTGARASGPTFPRASAPGATATAAASSREVASFEDDWERSGQAPSSASSDPRRAAAAARAVAKVAAAARAAVVAAAAAEVVAAGVADARSTHGSTLPMTGAMTEPEPIRKTRLRSGLRIVTERLPGLRSAAVGCWVGTGSRDEPEALAGASHFLEHLLFKGTDRRTAVEIAEAVESVGGDMNAFTAQEFTSFYVRVPDTSLPLAIDILSDIVWSPAFRDEDVDCERQVILEEIRMRDDTPDDLVHDLFANAVFPDHPIGREVIGSPETIQAMSRADIARVPRRALPPEQRRDRRGRQHRARPGRRARRGGDGRRRR